MPLGFPYRDLLKEGNEEGGDYVYGKTSYFLEWSMLEGPCLWALRTLMHKQGEKRGWRRCIQQNRLYSDMIQGPWLQTLFTLMHMQNEKERVAKKYGRKQQNTCYFPSWFIQEDPWLWGLYLDADAEWEAEGGNDVYGKTSYFLEWSMLEGLCLWPLCTFMHMQSEKEKGGDHR